MKARDNAADVTITQGALPGSEKIYVKGERVSVAMRRIALTDTIDEHGVRHPNEPVVVYETSGPYTDQE